MANNSSACSMCKYTCNSENVLKKHLIRYHRNDPHFIATCQLYQYQSRSYIAYKKHIVRCKKRTSASYVESLMNSDIGDYEMEMNDLFSDDDFLPSTTENESDLTASMASFFLKLEAKHGLSQTCVDSIVEEVDTLLDQVLEKLKKKIKCFIERSDFRSFGTRYLSDRFPRLNEHCF